MRDESTSLVSTLNKTDLYNQVYYDGQFINRDFQGYKFETSTSKKSTFKSQYYQFTVISPSLLEFTGGTFVYIYLNSELQSENIISCNANDVVTVINLDKDGNNYYQIKKEPTAGDGSSYETSTEISTETLLEYTLNYQTCPYCSEGDEITLTTTYNQIYILNKILSAAGNGTLPIALTVKSSDDFSVYKTLFDTYTSVRLDLYIDFENDDYSEAFTDTSYIKYLTLYSETATSLNSAFKNNTSLIEVDVVGAPINCDLDFIFENNRTLVNNIQQDGMIEVMQGLDVYDKWFNGEDRSYFYGCPYNGTLLDSQVSYDNQLANSFNPHWLLPEIIGKSYANQNIGSKILTGTQTSYSDFNTLLNAQIMILLNNRIYTTQNIIQIKSYNLNESSAASWVKINGTTKYSTTSRGHTAIWFRFDGTDVHTAQRDTYGSPGSLYSVINSVPVNYYLILYSWDATSLTSAERNVLKQFGSTNNSSWTSLRISHAFVGYRGCTSASEIVTYRSGGDQTASGTGRTASYNAPILSTSYYTLPNSVFNCKYNFLYHKDTEIPYPRAIVPAAEYLYWTYVLRNIKSVWDACGFVATINNEFDVAFLYYNEDAWDTATKLNTYIKDDWKSGDPFNIYLYGLYPRTSETEVCNGLFDGIEYLKSVNTGAIEGFSDLTSIFANCANLEYVDMQATVDVADKICYGSFKNVPEPDLDNFKIATTTAISAFESTYFISNPTFFSNWIVNTAKRVFAKSGIVAINDSVFPEGIEDITQAFDSCEDLVSVQGSWVEPNASLYFQNYTLDEPTLTQIKDWEDPTTQKGLTIPSSVVTLYQLFHNCSNLASVKDLKLSTGINDWCFQDCTAMTECYNVFLNETADLTGVFDNVPQNDTYRIWIPRFITDKSPYSNDNSTNFLNTGLSSESVPSVYCDDGFILINDEFIDNQTFRRLEYRNILDPKKNYIFHFFSHIHAHSGDGGYNELHNVNVYYK